MNLTICGSASLVSHVMTYFMFRTFQNVRPSEFLEGAWEVLSSFSFLSLSFFVFLPVFFFLLLLFFDSLYFF